MSKRVIAIVRLISIVLCLLQALLCDSVMAQGNSSSLRGQGVVSAQNERGQSINLYTGSYALVIAVSKYTNGWKNLPGAEEDLVAVSSELRKHGFQVAELKNPTREALISAIENFISQYGELPDARLLIYFAGHGATLTTPDGRELGYIVPADAPAMRNQAAFKLKAVSMQAIDNYAQQISAKHALFVFDSCFSGTIFDALKRSGPPPIISLKATQPVRQFITAGTADQEVPDRSIFRQQFIKGLQGEADANRDGYIVGTELGDYLEANVYSYSNKTQTPQHGKIRQEKLDKGDFIFLSPASKQAAITATPPPGAMPTPTVATNSKPAKPILSESEKLVGEWQADVNERGQSMRIIWVARADGTTRYRFIYGNRQSQYSGTWHYSDGILYEKIPNGTATSSVKWIDDNHFVLTVLAYRSPSNSGVMRHYHRR